MSGKRPRLERVSFAASGNSIQAICKLHGGINHRLPGELGLTALMVACREGDSETVSSLLANGANAILVDSRGFDALMYSLRDGNVAVARMLLVHLQNENPSFVQDFRTKLGLSHILYAATLGRTDCLSELVEFGSEVDAADESGFTPLMGAVQQNHVHTAVKLLELGSFVNMQDVSGLTALAWGTRSGSLDAVQLLLDSGGADVDLSAIGDRSPLFWSVVCGQSEIGKLLLEAGSKISNTVRLAVLLDDLRSKECNQAKGTDEVKESGSLNESATSF